MLNSEQLKQYITNWEFDPNGVQQVGIDLNVISIKQVMDGGQILCEGTTLPPYNFMDIKMLLEDRSKRGWLLDKGVYEVTFAQGCKVPPNAAFFIRQRSSLARCGILSQSSVFDPGFETEAIGTFIEVFLNNIFIEYNARLCQIYAHECTPVTIDNLYKGQWQNDRQRNNS